MSDPDNNSARPSEKALVALGIACGVGLLLVLSYAANTTSLGAFFSVVSVASMLAGASAFVGGTLGFLFGIPRTLQDESGSSRKETRGEDEDEQPTKTRSFGYRANTNLEQISDWLTKILVGVGLTQINGIRAGIGDLTAYVAPGLGGRNDSQVFALTVLTFFVVVGFLIGYLWTRLFLAGALRIADQAAIGELETRVLKVAKTAAETNERLHNIERQAELDSKALSLVTRQLNPVPGLPGVMQDELNSAIASASRPVKVQAFNSAWQNRSENWRDPRTKQKMELSVPIFRALIHDDIHDEFHRNHGQLAYALKDKSDPDWVEAEKEFNKAIELRGDWRHTGWLFYEFNRAICRIQNDEAMKQGVASDAQTRDAIRADLKVASEVPELRSILMADPVVEKWMVLNKVTKRQI